ncbi:MAG: TonB-dependent receptor family protein [Bacteroidota bacterium]
MKNLCYLLLFLQMALPSSAQSQKTSIVSGQVVDRESDQVLSYATIQLFDMTDDQLVAGGISDEEGRFSIALPVGSFYAQVDFIAYESHRSANFHLEDAGAKIDLGEIRLKNTSSDLEEVVVRAERNRVELSLDKKIFNVAKDPGNAGRSAMEILNNVPSVTVDPEGTIKLRGSGNVRVLIDGKPSGLVSFKGGSGLQQLQGGLVERIEVITNPSARYEAEGMVGIINIILKKERKEGFNGSFEVNGGYPTQLGASVNLNYRHKKVNFFINYGIAYRIQPSVYSIRQQVFNNDSTFLSLQDYDGEHRGFHNNIRGGLDWFISEQDIVTASYYYSRSKGKRLTDLRYRDFLFDESQPIQSAQRTQDEDEVEPISEYVLSYQKLFGRKGQELNAELRYFDHWEDSDQLYTDQRFLSDGQLKPGSYFEDISLNDETDKQFIAQLDYIHPLTREGKIETGLRSNFRDMTNDFVVSRSLNAGPFIPLEGLDNNFIYKENINAVYATLSQKLGDFAFQLGLRGEWTDIETILEETNESNPRDYSNLFPSAHFTYDLPNAQALQLSYSRRVRRPVYNDLSPYVTFSDNRNFFSGNPDLDPDFSHVLELGHLKYFEKGSISAALYFRHTDDKIERIRRVDTLSGDSNTRPENLNSETVYGLEFIGSFKPLDRWKLDVDLNCFRAEADGRNIDPLFQSEAYTFFARQTSKWQLSKSSELQIRASYEAPQNTAQGKRKAIYFFDIAINKDVFKGKGKLTINLTDVFNTRRIRTTTRGPGFVTDRDFQWIRRQLLLSLNYRINQ